MDIFVYLYLISPKYAFTHLMWTLVFWGDVLTFPKFHIFPANIELVDVHHLGC